MNNIKRYTLSFFLLIFALTSFAKGGGYSIKLKVNGLKDTVCYLAYYYGDKQYLKDTAKVDSKGECTFKGAEALPGGIYLIVFPDKKKLIEVIVDKNQTFSVQTDTIDPVKHLVIKGSDENKQFYDYQNFIQKKREEIDPLISLQAKVKNNKDSSELLKKQISKINEEVKNYKSDFQTKNPDALLTKIFKMTEEVDVPTSPKLPDGKIDSTFAYRYYKAHYFDNIDFTDDRELRTPLFHPKLSSYLKNMIHPSPDSIIKECDMLVEKARPNKETFKYVVWYLTSEYSQSKIMGYDAIYVHMVEKYYMTNQAYWVTPSQLEAITKEAMKQKPILIGQKAPEINYLTSVNDKSIPLSSLKAKYVILIFWSPDCGHCKTEIPLLYKVYEKYKDKGVLAYSVSTVRDTAKTLNFIRENKTFDWINMLDLPLNDGNFYSNFRSDYSVDATPAVFLLDENKKIIAKKLSPDQIDSFLERFLVDDKDKKDEPKKD